MFKNESIIKDCEIIYKNVASAWKDLKYGYKKDQYLAHSVVEAVVVTNNKKNLKAAM